MMCSIRPVHIFRRRRLDHAIRSCNQPSSRPTYAARKKRIEHAIQHATHICPNFEDTIECRIAWDLVEELSAAEHDLKFKHTKAIEDPEDWEVPWDKMYDL